MSLGDAGAKFPGQFDKAHNIAPSPSRENPGAVFPKSDPHAAPAESVPGTGGEDEPTIQHTLSNPYVFEEKLERVDAALADAVATIRGEEGSQGASGEADALSSRFGAWRAELRELTKGRRRVGGESAGAGPEAGSGMFTD